MDAPRTAAVLGGVLIAMTVFAGCSTPAGGEPVVEELIGDGPSYPPEQELPECPDYVPPTETTKDGVSTSVVNSPPHCTHDYWAYASFQSRMEPEVVLAARDLWWEGRAEIRDYREQFAAGAAGVRPLSSFVLGDAYAAWCTQTGSDLTTEQIEADANTCFAMTDVSMVVP